MRQPQPFPSADAANAALEAFYADVEAAAEKHGITTLIVVPCVEATYEDGEVGRAFGWSSRGDELLHESLAAWAHGRMAAESRERIAKLLRGEKRKAKP